MHVHKLNKLRVPVEVLIKSTSFKKTHAKNAITLALIVYVILIMRMK